MKSKAIVLMATLLILSALVLKFNIDRVESSGPSPIEWSRTYGGTGDDWGLSLAKTDDGGYVLAGATCSYSSSGLADVYLVKTDGRGIMRWNRTYGEIYDYDDGASSVIQTSDGGFALAGYTASSVSDDVYFVKTDSSGIMEWSKVWRGSGGDFAYSVVQTTDDGYALAGWTDSFGDGLSDDFYLIKTDSSGNTQWFKTYGGTMDEQAYSVVQTSDGGYVLAGYTFSFGAGDHDFWLVKTDSAGNHLWNETYGGAYCDEAYAVIQTSDGGYALAGTRLTQGGESYGYLVKTDGSGNMEWSSTYGGTDYIAVYSVVQTSDGGYVLAGYADCFGVDDNDAWLVKTDSLGNTEWRKTYGGTQADYARSVVQATDGGYALAGWTDSDDGDEDVLLIKTESNPSPVHDVAVVSIHPSQTVVAESSICELNVTVVNRGDFVETFDVDAQAMIAPPAINIWNVSVINLQPDEARNATIFWNATSWAYGNYTISASISFIQGEIDLSDNIKSTWALVTIPGDVDGDCDVDIFDIVRMAGVYGVNLPDSRYNPNCDIDDDRDIDIFDIVAAADNYGKNW